MIYEQEEIEDILRRFHGSEIWRRHPVFQNFTYTEGVHFLVEYGRADWLIDLIFVCQYEIPALRNEAFQIWQITAGDNDTFHLICRGGDGTELHNETLPRQELPLENVKFYFKDSVLMLPSEY